MALVQGCNADGEVMSDFYVEHDRVDLFCPPEEGMTRQEFRDECDINVLMAHYETSGIISHINPRQPLYLDVTAVPDLAGALDVVDRATAAFMTLPAKVRAEFENDPVKFVDYAVNPDNVEKLREWGLAEPRAQVAPTPEAASPAAP